MTDGLAFSGFSPAHAGAVLAASALLSAGLILLLHPLLVRYALARPNARSSHVAPTPQGGGLAVIAATLLTSAAALLWLEPTAGGALGRLAIVAIATCAIAALGFVDDIRPMPVAPRLLWQALAVAAVIATLPGDLRAFPVGPLWIERAVLALALLWFVNLVNFMDGIDWMTVAEAVPVASALALLWLMGMLPGIVALVAVALLGAVIGFAPFNRPVAKLFLGDVGSLPIGLLLGWMLILLAGHGHLAAAVLLPLYYAADATITLARRAWRGERLWQAHRTHFYQQAVARGFSVRQVIARVFALNLALAALALFAASTVLLWQQMLAFAAGAALVAAVLTRFAAGPQPKAKRQPG